MYKYKSLNDKKITEKFFEKFVDREKLKNTTILYNGYDVCLFDFIKNSRIILYEEVMEYIKKKFVSNFIILWNLTQRYVDDNIYNNYKAGEIYRDDLIYILKDQQHDMCNNQLCYYNKNRAEFWDLIIFDEMFMWCIAVTHEDNVDGNRLCFISGTV